MFILRPSSLIKARPDEPELAREIEEIKAIPVEEEESEAPAEPYIDEGLPVPEIYDVDIIRAMLQDPFRIFIYWEVREESLQALTRYFSAEDAASFQTTLKLLEVEGRNEAYFPVGRHGRYWMMVFPDREYEFEIGVRSPVHGYISLIRSNRVRTPRGTVSPEKPAEGEYRLSPPDFLSVIQASGFAADQTMEITVAAMPGAALDSNQMGAVLLRLPGGVRSAVMAAGAGDELTAEMIEGLPLYIRDELMKLYGAGDGRIASVGLMHYLPELLREALEDERELIGDRVHPLHLAPRYFVGGTENLTWPGGEIRWPGLPRQPSSDVLYQRSDVKAGASAPPFTSDIIVADT
jgi:hypothetical protein